MCKSYVKAYYHMLAETDPLLFTMCKSYVNTCFHMLAKIDPQAAAVISLIRSFFGSLLSLSDVGKCVWPAVSPFPHLSDEGHDHILL